MSLRQLWWRWKSLRLPWRKQFLVGQDLNGNTYWEFKDQMSSNPNRMRRIVKGPRKMHHADVQSQISPLWHQWLRQTRRHPPSIQEQQMDVQRQITLKHNALLADERWNSKKRYIEKPRGQGQDRQIEGESAPRREMEERAGVPDPAPTQPDPWQQERQRQKETATNPGGTWQPESWTPGPPGR